MLQQLRNKIPFSSSQLSTQANTLSIWQYVLLGILTLFCCYYGISSYAILDMNEGLYAEIAREMIVHKHYIIPYLNDIPYLEKPPLLYWLLALSYHFFGVNAFAARVIPSTFMALTCLSLLCIGKKLQALRTGFIASIILLTSIVFIMIGRTVFFDMLLTFFISSSLFAFYFWTQLPEENQQHTSYYLYLGYIFLAFAILSKGFLALILVPLILGIFLWIMKAEKNIYLNLFNKKALIIFLIIVLPWHLFAMLSFAQFTWEYFINNQLLRFFSMRIPDDYHSGPLYFYIPRVVAYLLPWSIFLPFIFWPLKLKRPFDALNAFLWTWFLVMFVFFSISGDKGDYYLVIGIIPLAWLLAQKIEGWFVAGTTRWLTGGFYLITIALSIAGILSLLLYRNTGADLSSQMLENKIPIMLTHPILFLLVVIIIYGTVGFYFCRHYQYKENPLIPFLAIAGLIIPVLFFYLSVRERTQFMYSQITLANYIQHQYEHRPTYLYQDFETVSSFIFYNQESSIVVDSKSADLYFGSKTDAGKGKFISLQDFLNYAKTTSLYIIVRASKLPEFEKVAGKNVFCIVQRNGKILLLSNAEEDCRPLIQVGEQKEINLDNLKKDQNEKIPHQA